MPNSDPFQQLDVVAALVTIASFLLGAIIVLGGYIWRTTTKKVEDQHAVAIAMVKTVQDAVMASIKEFSQQNREEHEAFEERLRTLENDNAYRKGHDDGAHSL